MDTGAIEMTSVAGQGRLRSTSFLAALGAAAILMTGCSEESVSPTGPSPVSAVAAVPATANSASADGVSPAGLLEPGRGQQTAPPGVEGGVMIEAEDTVPSTAAAFRPWQPADTVVLNLTAEPNEDDGTIELSWGAPTYERFQIRDYRYRIDARNWKTVGPNVLSVLIDAVSNQLWGGRRYQFEVRARFGTQSHGFAGRKASIWAEAPGNAGNASPHTPLNLSHEFLGDDVSLTWRENPRRGDAELLRWELRVGQDGEWWSSDSTRTGWVYGPSPFKVHVTRTSEAPPQTNKHVG